MIITVVVAACALIVGVVGRRLLRDELAALETPTLTVRDFVLPLQALTVFVLAYVLVMASGSNGRAEEAVRQETEVLDHMYKAADFAPAAPRQRLQADLICYVRAVRSAEWAAMAHGQGSPVPDVWSSDFHATFKTMDTKAAPFSMLVSADRDRDQARQTRVAESTPAIPGAVYWLLLAALAILVITLGLCLPPANNATVTAALVVLTALLACVLLTIRDVERPFSGVIQIKPSAMTALEDNMTKDFTAAYGNNHLPCDENGSKHTTQ
ncbi:DUF4239 domain-containing protein [Streptomyces sp. NPDC026206]|uniref:bestrophin-like domain n=1 Tax=Streptomyces sp. NPDC026206 TaxID=3157089 RepID=UPI0033C31120